MNQKILTLPKPTIVQSRILNSHIKRKVLCWGRRAGKTTCAAIKASKVALEGKRVLYAAPSLNQVEFFWNMIKLIFAPLNLKPNETKHRLILPNGGAIRAKTAWDANSLRGDYADLLIFEEYAYMNSNAWEAVGAPMLLDNDGEAWFMSSPKRHNHFYNLYNRAKEDDRWASFHCTSYNNPYLSKEALNDIIRDMINDNYRQEIMAEFLQNAGAVFRLENVTYTNREIRGEHKGHTIVFGVDLGKVDDYTVISIGCAICQKEVELYRSRHKSYIHQINRLVEFRDYWKPDSIVVEANSMGAPIIEMLRERGVEVQPFTTTNQSKGMIIENLALQLEKGEWQFQDNEIATSELKAYESKLTRNGNIVYSAPSGLHDDTVMARAMMTFRAGRL